MNTVKASGIAAKRRKGVTSEYDVKFATGEVLYLPPRKVCQKPTFKDGKLVTIDANDAMSPELQAMCAELIENTDGPEIQGKALELLFGVAAQLILAIYDVTDDDLTELLTLSYGTSDSISIKEQWPSKIYRWVIGGDEMTGLLNG